MCQVYVLDQQIFEPAVVEPIALRFPTCHVRITPNGATLETRPDMDSEWVDYTQGTSSLDDAIARERVIARVDRAVRPYIFANMDEEVYNQFKSIETCTYAHTLKSEALRSNRVISSVWDRTDIAWYEKIIGCFVAMCQTTFYGFYYPLYLTIYS